MCIALDEKGVYFRPWICRGNPLESKTFLVGINPATPICSEEIDLDSYVRMLEDSDAFLKFYSERRVKAGKTRISPTRQGIHSFGRWLEEKTQAPVIETNVIAYPTKNVDELSLISDDVIEQGRQIFRRLLMEIRPTLIIIHGADAVPHFLAVVKEEKLVEESLVIKGKISQMEKDSPILSFTYSTGETATVFACRHLVRYKEKGLSYELFRSKIEEFMQKNQ